MRINTYAPAVLISLLLTSPLLARKPDRNSPLPRYQVGVTGIYAIPQRDKPHVVVDATEPGSPAAGKFEKGDLIVAVNGVQLAPPDSRVQLGDAITQAEATDGKFTCTVKRGGATRQVTIVLPVLGAYSKTWPINCDKSKKIVAAAAGHIAAQFRSGKLKLPGRAGPLGVLFLLSTGEDKYLPACRVAMRAFAAKFETVRSHTWNNGFLSIALGEYYLRTGDKSVLKPLQAIADDSYGRMTCGGWGHWDYPTPEYTRSGLVNAAGGKLFVGMMLARECGVKIKNADLKHNIRYFYRYAGFGGVPYGDQRPSAGGSTNGKSGMAGVGLGLLPDACYQKAARQKAVEQADSYFGFEGGHTGNMTNVLWRNLCIPLVPADMQHHYRKHMDSLRWYYELCRHPAGGFRMLPTRGGENRYAAEEWALCVGLGYTAGWKKLRMCGAPPTRFSKISPVGVVMKKHDAFITPRHAEGMKESDFQDLQTIAGTLKWNARRTYKDGRGDRLPSVEYIARHFRHYNPLARNQAASAIGYHGDAAIPHIIKALKSNDPRVRRAGLQGMSGYLTFFMEKSRFTYSAAGVEKVVPHIKRILKDPRSDMWEIDGALWAMSTADKKTIAANLDMLRPFLKHEEWWVQSAAFVAIAEADDLAGPAMGDLVEAFASHRHVASRNDFLKRLNRLMVKHKVSMTPAVRKRAVQLLGEDLIDLTDRERSYVMKGTGYYDISNIRVLLLFEPGELAKISDYINQELAKIGNPNVVLEKRTNYQNLAKLLIGDKGAKGLIPPQPGLISSILKMTPADRAKVMPGLKALLAGGLDKMFTPRRRGKELLPAIENMKRTVLKMLAEHERKHGRVKPFPAPKQADRP